MRLFASSTLFWGKSMEEIAEVSYRCQLEGIEVWAEQVWFNQMQVRDIVETAQTYGLELSVHAASWDLNLCSLNEGIRQRSIEEIKRSMKLAKAIGAKNVTIHPGRCTLTSDWTRWHFVCLQESLDQLVEFAESEQLTISIELMEEIKKEFITDPEALNDLIGPYPAIIQTTFDVAHISMDKDILQTYMLLDRVNHIHLSDSSLSHYHVALGEGELDLTTFINYIKNAPYPVVLEGYDPSGEARLLRKHLDYLIFNGVLEREEMKS